MSDVIFQTMDTQITDFDKVRVYYAFADIDGEVYFAKIPIDVFLNKDTEMALEIIKQKNEIIK